MKSLMVLSSCLWGGLFLLSCYFLFQAMTERTSSPEVGQGFAVFTAGLLMLVVIAIGAVLYWVGKHQTSWGGYVLAVVMGWPLFVMIARPVVLKMKDWRYEREQQRNGDFHDARLKPLAKAILADREDELKHLLDGRPPPAGRDQAGNDLLSLAVFAVGDRKVGIGPLRILLEAGADPRQSKMPNGRPLITALILSGYRTPKAQEAIKLLLEHGADPDAGSDWEAPPIFFTGGEPEILRMLVEHGANINQTDLDGSPPIVKFTRSEHWDAAIYLIEKGARMDLTDKYGKSLDNRLKEQDELHVHRPEGLDKLLAAIAKQRDGK